LLNSDVAAIESLYHSRGYLNVKVTPHLATDYQGQAGNLFLVLEIDEGPQTTTAHMEIHGLPHDFEKATTASLANAPGKPFSPDNALNDRETILSDLANRGYMHANMTWKSAPGFAPNTVDLQYDVAPGRKETIRRIAILGNEHTRLSVIQKEITLRAGQPFNESAVRNSQQRLYNLGVFNQVKIAEQAPDSSETDKTLLVDLEETKRWTLGYGAGLEVQRLGSNQPQGQFKASPRLSLDVTRLNVGGRAQTADLRGQLSTLEKIAQFTYLIPRFTNHPDLSLRFNALTEQSANVLTFTAKRQEISEALEKRFSPTTLISGRFNYRNVQALDISNRISPNEIPILSQPARIGMFSMDYINDHRDNPIDATRGSYSLADAGISWTDFGSESNFIRFFGQNSTYYRISRRLTFARSTRFGFESPFGSLRKILATLPNGQKETIFTHEIPLPERFFMGGSDSHRGFSINQAGPRDPLTGFPLGGNALFLNSLELRMRFAQDRLGLVLFHDMGNVYSSIRKMRLFKVSQSSPTDFDYTVHAVGFGVLYNTPVGPLRFNMGYALNPPRFNVQTVANGITNTEVQRLSQFQFFISVGQSF
jgi:outer membrane protein insertion porin family